jgi:hypothetical protein
MAQGPAYSLSLLLACFLGFAPLASAQSAEPSKRAAALHWVRMPGAEDCSGGDVISRAVEAKLRREVFPAPRDASVLIEGRVERAAGGYRASLEMRASDGTLLGSRELSSPKDDCEELSETVAVVLAVMIDPDAAPGNAGTRPPEPPAGRAQPKDPRRAQRLLVVTRGALHVTEQPDAALQNMWGAGIAYERGLGRWGGLRVEGIYFAPREYTLPQTQQPGGQVVAVLAYAGLGYCPLWLTLGRLRSAACASGELGGLRWYDKDVGGTGKLPPSLWLSVSAQARLALRVVGPVELHVAGGLTGVIIGAGFRDPAYGVDVSTLQGTVDFGLGARF